MIVAICLYGKMGYMDSFMIQSLTRCVISPIKKYFHGQDIEVVCFLHTFFSANVFCFLETMRMELLFQRICVEDEKGGIFSKKQPRRTTSRKKTEKMSMGSCLAMVPTDVDYTLMIRLDLLLTRSLTPNDIDSITDGNTVMMPDQLSPETFLFGRHDSILKYVKNLISEETNGSLKDPYENDVINVVRTCNISVRICADGTIYKHDANICPYINDLILSSSTKIQPLPEDDNTFLQPVKKRRSRIIRSISSTSTISTIT